MSQPNKEAELAEAKEKYDREVPIVSECCGAGTHGDVMLCESCQEHVTGEREISFEEFLDELNNKHG